MKKDQTIKDIVNKISIEKIQQKGVIYAIIENYYRGIQDSIVSISSPQNYKTFIVPNLGKFVIKYKQQKEKEKYYEQSADDPEERGERD